MVNRIYETAMGIARGTALAIGVAVMLAMLLGVATTALAGTGVGARFQLGKVNTVNAITKLVASVAGPSLQIDNNSTNTGATALDLQVEPGKAPMKVNSASKVANLNADKLDGKSEADFYAAGSKVADASHADQADSATSAQNADTVDGKSANEIGVNGYSPISISTPPNSDSPKELTASCSQDRVVLGIAHHINGGLRGSAPDQQTDVVVDDVVLGSDNNSVFVRAYEEEPTSAPWTLQATAICAKAP